MSSIGARAQAPGGNPQWRLAAACRGTDPDVFFPADEAGSGPAKAICVTCSERSACLRFAVVTNQSDGVWGGMTRKERGRLRRRWRVAVSRASSS